jgi:predicted tellurium resistance membrane protein TerC
MIEFLTSPEVLASLLTLTILEIVLGIDNIIFISIVAAKLPVEQQAKARMIGLSLALIMRLVLLSMIAWLASLTQTVFSVMGLDFSWRDIILVGGGLFLLVKGTMEMVFSLDSVITAIGMTDQLPIMVAAVVIAMAVMLFAAKPVSEFVNAHPTVKMLALSFLILVGVALVADGFGHHIPRGYLYFAVAFSLGVECLNLWSQRNRAKKLAKK